MRVLVAASTHRQRLHLDVLVRQSGVAELVSSTALPAEWSALVHDRGPDVVVADSPDAAGAGAPVLVVAAQPAVLDGPVRGSLPTGVSAEELAAALRAIEAGLLVLHPSHHRTAARLWPEMAASTLLSPRESEVLALLAEGLGNKEIAARLGVSENTIKFHVSSIMDKLDAGSRTEAVARGIRQGLVVV